MTIIKIEDELTGKMEIITDFDRFKRYLSESINFSKLYSRENPIAARDVEPLQGCVFADKVTKFYKEGF